MSEETNPRDTQFKGFAQSLAAEIADGWQGTDVKTIIARRAYDLACHVISETDGCAHPEPIVDGIPDLTTWPQEQWHERAGIG